jgi:hypothetical protein
MVSRRVAATVTGIPAMFGRHQKKENPPDCGTRGQSVVGRCSDCDEQESNKIDKQLNRRTKDMAKNETSSQLATALQAAQARLTGNASTNPAGLSEGLVRQTEIPEIDFASETAQALETLETAVVEYQGREGQPNRPLIEAKQAVALLEAQLTEARAKLKELESKGTWLDHFNSAVYAAERRVEGLVGHYERLVIDQLIHLRYGQQIGFAKLGSEAKADLRMHVRVTNLRQFHLGGRDNFERITPEYLLQRAERAGKALDALRRHIQADQAERNAKK